MPRGVQDFGQTTSPKCTTTRDLFFDSSAIVFASSNTESRASSRSRFPVGDNSKTSKFFVFVSSIRNAFALQQ